MAAANSSTSTSNKQLPSGSHTETANVASKSLRSLTLRLVQLCDSQSKGDASNREIEGTLHNTRLRSHESARVFREYGGLEALLNASSKLQPILDDDCKTLTLIWDTLANVCALDEISRDKCAESVPNELCRLLSNCSSAHLLNMIACAIGNIASSGRFMSTGRGEVFVMVRELTRAISLHKNTDCLQSCLRAIRLLGSDGALREELKLCKTLTTITSNCLGEESPVPVVSAALHALDQLVSGSSCSSPELLSTLWSLGNEPISVIGRFVLHSNHLLQQRAVSILHECAKCSDGKAVLSRAGGIEYLVRMLSSKLSQDEHIITQTISCLCLCCRDVHSRQKLRDCGGLHIIVEILRNEQHVALHSDILSALVCYYFDENTLRYMVRCLGLIRSLVYQLASMAAEVRKTNSLAASPESPDIERMSTPSSLGMELAEVGSVCLGEEEIPSLECSIHSSPIHSDIKSPSSNAPQLFDHSRPLSPKLLSAACSSEDLSSSSPLPSDDNIPLQIPSVALSDTSVSEAAVVSPLSTSLSPHSFSLSDETSLQKLHPSPSFSASNTKPKVQLDHTATNPMPAGFIDSLLSSSAYYHYSPTPKEDSSFSVTDSKNTACTKTLLLLSRVSHIRDCVPYLASSDTLPVVIEYFFATGTTDVHCFKVLSRVVSNPHCFQDCVLNLVPSLILEHMSDTSIALQNTLTDSDIASSCSSARSPLNSTVSEDTSVVFNMHQDCCQQLFDKLSHVAESPFGQGVIANFMLRGDNKETTAGVLALTLLQKSPANCRRMLLTYNGLHYLTSMVHEEDGGKNEEKKDTSTVETQSMAITALLSLVQHCSKLPNLKKRRLSGNHTLSANQSHSTPVMPAKRQRSGAFSEPASCTDSALLPSAPLSFCRYRDTDHTPFDLIVMTSYKERKQSFSVHRRLLMECSEVFRAMLGGSYRESSSMQVNLHEVLPTAFESLLHHVYGCCWNCTGNRLDSNLEQSSEEIRTIFSILLSSYSSSDVIHTLEVFACANQFFIPSLVAECEMRLVASISPDNLVPLFLFAQLHDSETLSRSCVTHLINLSSSSLKKKLFKQLLQSSDCSCKFLHIIESMFQ